MQIGQSMLNYESANQKFPTSIWQMDLLPFMGLDAVKTGFDNGVIPSNGLPSFLCPSDQGPQIDRKVTGNFVACVGRWVTPSLSHDGVIDATQYDYVDVTTSDVLDGLSNTAFCSEVLRRNGSDSAPFPRLRKIWDANRNYGIDEFDEFVNYCLSIPADPQANGIAGSDLRKGVLFVRGNGDPNVSPFTAVHGNLYNHAVPPQNPSVDNGADGLDAAATATSGHSVVSVVFCDGHVKSVGSDIDIKAWQGFGDRNGNRSKR